MRAFGSRVTGGARPWSDLDLAVLGRQRLGFERVALLREAFDESTLPFRVDVVDWHAISDGFRVVIERRHEVVQPGAAERPWLGPGEPTA